MPATAASRRCVRTVTRVRRSASGEGVPWYRQPAPPAPSRAGSGRPIEKPWPYSTPSALGRLPDRFAFDAFGHGLELHGARQLHDGAQHRLRAVVHDHVADEAAVDLEVRHGQRLQVRERTEAAAEIVEGDVAAQFTQPPDQRLGAHDVGHRRGLGHLERQQPARQPAFAQRRVHEDGEVRVAERLPGDVDGETGLQRVQARRVRREHLDRRAARPSGRWRARAGSVRPPTGISPAARCRRFRRSCAAAARTWAWPARH